MLRKNYFVAKTFFIALLLFSANCRADIWRCAGKNGEVTYTDVPCGKEMSGIKIYEKSSNASIEARTLPLFSYRHEGTGNRFVDESERNAAQLSTDVATIKRAREMSMASAKSGNALSELSNSKNDSQKTSVLLSQRRWAYFVKEKK